LHGHRVGTTVHSGKIIDSTKGATKVKGSAGAARELIMGGLGAVPPAGYRGRAHGQEGVVARKLKDSTKSISLLNFCIPDSRCTACVAAPVTDD